jgi:hypothetical protein
MVSHPFKNKKRYITSNVETIFYLYKNILVLRNFVLEVLDVP